MSDDTKKTDEVAVDEQQLQTDESSTTDAAQQGTPASQDDPNQELDLANIISKSKTKLKSKDERGNLSRKDAAALKGIDVEEIKSDLRETVKDEVLAEVREEFAGDIRNNNAILQRTEQNQLSQMIKDKVSAKGIDGATFNAQYKDALAAKKEELESKGLSEYDATETALGLVLGQAEKDSAVAEAEKRAEGRKSASLPPTGSTYVPQPDSVQQKDVTQKLTPEQLGSIDLSNQENRDFVKKYTNHWNKKEVEEKYGQQNYDKVVRL